MWRATEWGWAFRPRNSWHGEKRRRRTCIGKEKSWGHRRVFERLKPGL